MSYDPLLEFFGPVQLGNFFAIYLPERLRGAGQAITFCWQMMRLAEEVRQRKPQVKTRISNVNDFVIEQDQFVLVDKRVFGTEITVDQAVFVQ